MTMMKKPAGSALDPAQDIAGPADEAALLGRQDEAKAIELLELGADYGDG